MIAFWVFEIPSWRGCGVQIENSETESIKKKKKDSEE